MQLKPVKIDPEFQALIFPLAEEEFTGLSQSIIAEGCRDALITWNGILLDGHHRHAICQENNIQYRTTALKLPDRDAAKVWIIQNQFARRNINNYQRAELALKLESVIAVRRRNNRGHGQTFHRNL